MKALVLAAFALALAVPSKAQQTVTFTTQGGTVITENGQSATGAFSPFTSCGTCATPGMYYYSGTEILEIGEHNIKRGPRLSVTYYAGSSQTASYEETDTFDFEGQQGSVTYKMRNFPAGISCAARQGCQPRYMRVLGKGTGSFVDSN
jgi:positive regulator of sigma E activity